MLFCFSDMQGALALFPLVSSLSLPLSLTHAWHTYKHACVGWHRLAALDVGAYFYLMLMLDCLIWQCLQRTMPILLHFELGSIWSQIHQILVQWQVVHLLDEVAWAEQVEALGHQVRVLLWDHYLHSRRMLKGLCSTVRLAGPCRGQLYGYGFC